jgi:hypothetical protein
MEMIKSEFNGWKDEEIKLFSNLENRLEYEINVWRETILKLVSNLKVGDQIMLETANKDM